MPPLIRGGGENLVPSKSQFSSLAHSTTEEKGDFQFKDITLDIQFSGEVVVYHSFPFLREKGGGQIILSR